MFNFVEAMKKEVSAFSKVATIAKDEINKLISELDDLEYLFVPPGPGDESISIGAAYLAGYELSGSVKFPRAIKNAYFPKYSQFVVLFKSQCCLCAAKLLNYNSAK